MQSLAPAMPDHVKIRTAFGDEYLLAPRDAVLADVGTLEGAALDAAEDSRC